MKPLVEESVPIRPVVILPTFNNAGTLAEIVTRLLKLQLPVIAVNDGSTDATPAILAGLLAGAEPQLTVLQHEVNRGKAFALQTGFQAALAGGYTHAVTIDSDGQLDPEQIPDLLNVARSRPEALVLGVRDASRPDYPSKSRVGRRFSNTMIRLECGARVGDSQCGFRVYPLALMPRLACRAGRFGYETEIITRAVWLGAPILEVPVNCRYFSDEERITHFRPGCDSLRSLAMHLRLLPQGLWRRLRRHGSPDSGAVASAAWRRGELFWIVLLLSLGLLLRLGFILLYRFGTDEPQHLHVAWAWAHGLMQYRDVFDNHTPLFHMFCAPLVWLFGEHYYLLYLMRLAMVPFYAATLWGTYLLARALYPPRLAGWAVVLTGLFPLFFAGSVEFRTDDAWMAAFVLALAALAGGRLTPLRCLGGGLLLGLTLGISMKTSLLLACLAGAGALTPLVCAGRGRRLPPVRGRWLCPPALLLGLAFVPLAIIAWFYAHGALRELYYGVIQHNLLPKLGAYKDPHWKRYLFLPAVLGLGLVARWLSRHTRLGERPPVCVFLFLLAGIYVAALKLLWPLVTRQDFLPIWPVIMVLPLPWLDRPLPGWIRTRLRPGWSLGSGWGLLLACGLLNFAVVATPFYWVRLGHISRELAAWKAVLELMRPDETVLDPKGELIFRNRAFYWGLEKITRTRLERGLIPNTIVPRLEETRTCVVYPELDDYPTITRKYIQSNYLSIGPLLVAGKLLQTKSGGVAPRMAFEVRIPTWYVVLTPDGPAHGTIDGRPVPAMGVLLASGLHEYVHAPGETKLALLWLRAADHGFSPFKVRSRPTAARDPKTRKGGRKK